MESGEACNFADAREFQMRRRASRREKNEGARERESDKFILKTYEFFISTRSFLFIFFYLFYLVFENRRFSLLVLILLYLCSPSVESGLIQRLRRLSCRLRIRLSATSASSFVAAHATREIVFQSAVILMDIALSTYSFNIYNFFFPFCHTLL